MLQRMQNTERKGQYLASPTRLAIPTDPSETKSDPSAVARNRSPVASPFPIRLHLSLLTDPGRTYLLPIITPDQLSPKNTSSLGVIKLTFPLLSLSPLYHNPRLRAPASPQARLSRNLEIRRCTTLLRRDLRLPTQYRSRHLRSAHPSQPRTRDSDLLLVGRIYLDKGLANFQNALTHNIDEKNARVVMFTQN